MGISIDLIRNQAVRIIGNLDGAVRLNVTTDSRKPVTDGLFVPLAGEHFDGHAFLREAIQNGASAAFWTLSRPVPADLPAGFPLLFVRDTLRALQSLAKAYLYRTQPKIIAVTGSNGKTTTKDMVASILSRRFKCYKTQGNHNNHIGVPLTILTMPEDTEVLVLEMGMNHFGELTFLSQLARPDIAIITNIGESHLEYLGSRAGIAKAKLEITNGLKKRGTLIIDGDEPLLTNVHTNAFKIIKCGYGEENDWMITDAEPHIEGYGFSLNHGDEQYFVPVLGKHNVKNAVYALTVARILGMNPRSVEEGLKHLQLTEMRFERLVGFGGSTIINDCYNASPSSMKASVETLKALPGFDKRVAVLGDMYELGKDEKKMHRSVADVLTPPITHVVTIGSKGAWIADPLRERGDNGVIVRSFSSQEEAQHYLAGLLDDRTVMLFKASRLMELERLVAALK